jgi:rod shape-determining protein MreB and related proteins
MLGFLRSYFSNDLAIDLGTANTLIYVRGKGIVLDEPSVVAIRQEAGPNGKKTIQAVGKEAKLMLGKTPGNIIAIRPMKDGVIADFTVTEQMLKQFIKKVHDNKLFSPSPRIIICVPCGSTQVERRAIRESAIGAGAGQVYLIEEPMAAAIGTGLPIHEPLGNLVVDVGGGTSEVALISLGGIVTNAAVRIGGFDLDGAIQAYVRREYAIAIGERTAERIKIAIGSAFPRADEEKAEIRGRDLASGLPKNIIITSEELRGVLTEQVRAIISSVIECLGSSPPDLVQDVLVNGITLTGGGGILAGFDMLLSQEAEVPVHLSEQPLESVVLGAGKCLESFDSAKSIFLGAKA